MVFPNFLSSVYVVNQDLNESVDAIQIFLNSKVYFQICSNSIRTKMEHANMMMITETLKLGEMKTDTFNVI